MGASDVSALRKEFGDAMRKCAKLCFVHLPIMSVVCSVVFGGMLALVEGWSYEDSFFLVLAEITSTDIKIIQPVEPKGTFGKIVGCLVGLLSLAVFGGIAGIFSGPLLDPILAFGMSPDGPFRRELGLPSEASRVRVVIHSKTRGRSRTWTLASDA